MPIRAKRPLRLPRRALETPADHQPHREDVRDHSPASPTGSILWNRGPWNHAGQPGHDVQAGPLGGQALVQTQITRAHPLPRRGKGLHGRSPSAHSHRLIHLAQNILLDNNSEFKLVRQSILQSALSDECRAHELSFAASLQMLMNTWVLTAIPPTETGGGRESLVALRVLNGHADRVASRPDRVEPRAVKRRPAPIALLADLRDTARAKLIAGKGM